VSKNIVITGSSRGIGLGLAREFLQTGHRVVISSRTPDTLQKALESFHEYGDKVSAFACDVTDENQVQDLWFHAAETMGSVDIWISNAGIAHAQKNLWDIGMDEAKRIIDTNVNGTLNNIRVVISAMLAQGRGQFYVLEGYGSSGRVQKGLGVYGATKASVAFLNKTLAAELENTPVKIASVQPGMVITDMILDQFTDDPEGLEKAKPIFNIVASSLDEVCPVLADKMLRDNKNGAHIAFMNRFDYFLRFLTAPIKKRNLFANMEG